MIAITLVSSLRPGATVARSWSLRPAKSYDGASSERIPSWSSSSPQIEHHTCFGRAEAKSASFSQRTGGPPRSSASGRAPAFAPEIAKSIISSLRKQRSYARPHPGVIGALSC